MQTGYRKTTGNRGHRRFSKGKIRPAFASFALIFFISCATFQKPDQKNLLKNLNKICFSAEGKGRFILSSKRFAFDFESLISRENKKWLLAFHLPAIGERIVEVDYEKGLKKQNQKFKKLLKDINQEEFNDFLLSEFWQKMSIILKASETSGINLNWTILKNRFVITFPPERGYLFTFEAFDLDSFYKRIKVSIEKERDRDLRGPPLEIELFLDSCGVILD